MSLAGTACADSLAGVAGCRKHERAATLYHLGVSIGFAKLIRCAGDTITLCSATLTLGFFGTNFEGVPLYELLDFWVIVISIVLLCVVILALPR